MADLFADFEFSRDDKLGELRQEIAMRRHVYGRQVANGRMKQDKADRGIAIMEAIAADYEAQGRAAGACAAVGEAREAHDREMDQ